jgi:hypothetical protein
MIFLIIILINMLIQNKDQNKIKKNFKKFHILKISRLPVGNRGAESTIIYSLLSLASI